MRILQLGREYLYALLLEEGDALLGGAGDRGDGKDGTNGGADEIGVVKVCKGVADDDARGIGCIGTTKDGTQVAGLLHALQNNKEGLAVDSPTLLLEQGLQGVGLGGTDNGDNALGTATIGYALVNILRHFDN